MAYQFGKLVGWLLFPSMIALALATVGVALLVFARRPGAVRVGRVAAGLGVAALVVMTLTPFGTWIARPLEARFPMPAADAAPPEGIILLGGGVDSIAELRTGRTKYHIGAEAVVEAARLARRFPNVPVMTTGDGPFGADGVDYSSAASLARLLEEAGVARERIILLSRARTTWEEGRLSHEMLSPRPGARWYLVTSAWHMPRSIGAFRAAGWDGIVAWPSLGETWAHRSYNTAPGTRLQVVDVVTREWTGLALYRLLGRSSALFPAP
jgi:uncharacterized SAM-binding protein YcdF (DUF218 family)